MPTYSSTTNFDLSIDDIAEEAFERCGLQIRSGYDVKTARRSLNLMLAEWANRGLNLWTIQKQEKTLAADTTSLPMLLLETQVIMITQHQVLVELLIGTIQSKPPADDQLNTILNVR